MSDPTKSADTPIGFSDLERAKFFLLMREKQREVARASRANPLPRRTWRSYSRICIPGYLLSRPFAALANLLEMLGPEAGDRLERWLDSIDDIPSRNGRERALRSVARWLIEEPTSEQESTPEETSPDLSSPSRRRPSRGSDQ